MNFVNLTSFSQAFSKTLAQNTQPAGPISRLEKVDASACTCDNILNSKEIKLFEQELNTKEWIPVGLDGILSNYKSQDPIGSLRLSSYDESLAKELWRRLEGLIGGERIFDSHAATDWDNHSKWRAIGINPLMRFIRYQKTGLLVPHYDAPYIASDKERTLVTLVFYITQSPTLKGGATRFIQDPQRALPDSERDHSDWTHLAQEDQIIAQVYPKPGSVLIFDHRILHDSQPVSGMGNKIIMRTDVLYEKA